MLSARPPVLSAARVKENCFSLAFIANPIRPDLAEGVNRQLLPLFLAKTIIELEECKLDGCSVSFGIPYKFYFGTKTENLDFIEQNRVLVSLGEDLGLPSFWRFCPIAGSVDERQRPSGQVLREKLRDLGANRAGGGRCRAQARLQTGLVNNGSQSVSTFS